MAKVIIFGIQDFAELAHYYLENDSEHEVAAFCVSEKYIEENKNFKDMPIVSFETVEKIYPPSEYDFFAPMSPQQMNRLRENVYNDIKAKGYKLISYISSKATTFDNSIGDNCFILENNTIQPFTSIGNNVILWSGNHIGHHSKIKDHVMFTSHVVLSGHCVVEPNCFIGVNATIGHQVTIAKETLVGAGAVITKNTEEASIYVPAKSIKLDKKSSLIKL